MAKSQSESRVREAFPPLSLGGAEIPRFTRNRLRNLRGFAEGNREVPGPGKKTNCLSSLRGAQRRSNLTMGSLI